MARLGIASYSGISSTDIVQDITNDVKKDVISLGDSLLVDVKRTTPKDKGKARNGWQIKHSPTGFKIENRVEYIGPLNEGSSKQAPRDYVGKIIRKTQIK